MRMIADVVLTIAEISLAAAAITEFQIRMAHVSPAANHAAVGVGGLDGRCGCFVGAGAGERNGAGPLLLPRPPLSISARWATV